MSETLKRSVSEAEIMRAMGPASYELMESLDPTRNHVFTAIDQIGGARLAGAYLVGAAEHESLRNTENPLATALGNVTHALGYRLQGSGDNSEVLDAVSISLRMWHSAYHTLVPRED